MSEAFGVRPSLCAVDPLGRVARRAGFSFGFGGGELSAVVDQGQHGFPISRFVERNRNPMGFVHVVGGIDAVFRAQPRAGLGIDFDVHDVDLALARRVAELFAVDVEDNPVPFAVVAAPKHPRRAMGAVFPRKRGRFAVALAHGPGDRVGAVGIERNVLPARLRQAFQKLAVFRPNPTHVRALHEVLAQRLIGFAVDVVDDFSRRFVGARRDVGGEIPAHEIQTQNPRLALANKAAFFEPSRDGALAREHFVFD